MDITNLGQDIDRLEEKQLGLKVARDEAMRRAHDGFISWTSDLAAWRRHAEDVAEVIYCLEALEGALDRLTTMAELEQAMKEERWSDVATWATKLAELGPEVDDRQTPAPAFTTKALFRTMETRDRCATDLRNRGFLVVRDEVRSGLTVRTPAGWTGTPAHEVLGAHGGQTYED